MSITLPITSLSGITAGQTVTLSLARAGLTADPSNLRRPAHIQLFNDSGALFQLNFKQSGSSSMLSPGAWRSFALTPGESELDLLVISAASTSATANTLSGVYYAPGEPVPDIGAMGNSVANIGNGLTIVSVPSITIAGVSDVNVINTVGVTINNSPFVNIANTVGVNIQNAPNVNIANTPNVNVNSGSITANIASGIVNVANQLNPGNVGNFFCHSTTGTTSGGVTFVDNNIGQTTYLSGLSFFSEPLAFGNSPQGYRIDVTPLGVYGATLSFFPYATGRQGQSTLTAGGQGQGAQLLLIFGTPGYPCQSQNTQITATVSFVPTGSVNWYLGVWGYTI